MSADQGGEEEEQDAGLEQGGNHVVGGANGVGDGPRRRGAGRLFGAGEALHEAPQASRLGRHLVPH